MGRVGSRLRVTLATVLQTHKRQMRHINELSTLNHIPPPPPQSLISSAKMLRERKLKVGGGEGRELKVGEGERGGS